MNVKTIVLFFMAFVLAWQTAAAAQESADERFEKLLAAALKEPEKANWKEVRQAFSRTSTYADGAGEVQGVRGRVDQASGARPVHEV
jgi:hypothetical protein